MKDFLNFFATLQNTDIKKSLVAHFLPTISLKDASELKLLGKDFDGIKKQVWDDLPVALTKDTHTNDDIPEKESILRRIFKKHQSSIHISTDSLLSKNPDATIDQLFTSPLLLRQVVSDIEKDLEDLNRVAPLPSEKLNRGFPRRDENGSYIPDIQETF